MASTVKIGKVADLADKQSALAKQIEEMRNILEVSTEPMQRALDRMQAAADRGGWDEMIDATYRRIEATKDYAKIRGIVSALEQMLAKETSGPRRQRLEQLLKVAKAKYARGY